MSTIGNLLRSLIPLHNRRPKAGQAPLVAGTDRYRPSWPGQDPIAEPSRIERDMTLLGLKDSLDSARDFIASTPALRAYPLYGLLELMVASAIRVSQHPAQLGRCGTGGWRSGVAACAEKAFRPAGADHLVTPDDQGPEELRPEHRRQPGRQHRPPCPSTTSTSASRSSTGTRTRSARYCGPCK